VAVQHWLRADSPEPMERLLPEALSLLAAGLPTP
jgi:hypothetical protein